MKTAYERRLVDRHQEPTGPYEPLVSLSALDGPCVDFNSPPIRRGVYETELCLRIVDPLDEQAAVGYALWVIRDEHDVPSFHLLGRDHLDVILPKFILCGVFNDPGPDPKLEFGQHLCVSLDNEARAVKFVR